MSRDERQTTHAARRPIRAHRGGAGAWSAAIALSIATLAPSAMALDDYDDYAEIQNGLIDAARHNFEPGVTDADALFGHATEFGAELEARLRGEEGIEPLDLDAELRSMAELAASTTNEEVSNTALFGQSRFRIAFLLHRYRSVAPGGDWSTETRDAVHDMVRDAKWLSVYQTGSLDNYQLPRAGAWVLAGEATGDGEMLQEGINLLQLMLDRLARQGTHEPNSPHYAIHLWDNLVLMTDVQDTEASRRVRALLDYVALTAAHTYLPGGGLGAPQARGLRAGGTFVIDPDPTGGKHAAAAIKLLVGDPEQDAEPNANLALTDYVMPDLIRSIFLEKGAGYEFRTRHYGVYGEPPEGQIAYDVGWNGLPTVPWQTATVAGGSAQIGMMYGALAERTQDVSMGVYVRTPTPEPAFSVFSHVHSTRDGWESTVGPDGKKQAVHEYATYRRYMHGRMLVQLWDATGDRPHTQMHVPLFTDPDQFTAHRTVESGLANDWRIGQSGDAYIAILPLGQITAPEVDTVPSDGGLPFTRVELEALSGSIVEIASTDEYADIDAYAAELDDRWVGFQNTGGELRLMIETDGATGDDIKLDYRLDERRRNGVVQPIDILESGVMSSPFVSWDEDTFTLTVSRPEYGPDIVHDFGDPDRPLAPYSVYMTGHSLISKPLTLHWGEAVDDDGIDHYELWMRTDAGEELVKDGIVENEATWRPIEDGNVTTEYTASFFVRAVDVTGRSSLDSNVVHGVELGPVDIQPPTTPGPPTALALGDAVILSWGASEDDRGVTSYEIRRESELGTVFETSAAAAPHLDSEGLEPGTEYTYTVCAQDAKGNLSAPSEPVTVTTSQEFEPPEPVYVYGSAVDSRIDLNWFVYEQDESGTGSFLIFRDGAFVTFVSPAANHWWDTNVASGQAYTYTVYVWDVYGNGSPPSNSVTITAN